MSPVGGESGGPGLRLSVCAFLLSFGASWNAGNVGPIVGPLSDEFSVSLGAVGLLSGTLFFAGIVVSTFLGAELGRRVPLGAGLRTSCGLGAAGNAICALSPVFAGVAAGRLIAGVALGAAFLFGGAFTRAVGGARLIGVFGVGVTMGVAVALAVGSVLQDVGADWRLAFAISVVVALSPLPFLPSTMPAVVPAAEPQGGLWRQAVASAPLWRLLMLAVASFALPLVVGAWIVHYLTADGMNVSLAGGLGFLLFAVSAVFRDLSGNLLAGGAGPGTLSAGGCLIGAAGLVVLGLDASLGPALAAVVLIGAGLSLPYALVYDEGERVIPDRPLGGLGITIGGCNVLPILVVPLVGAALAAGDAEVAWLGVAALAVIAALLNARPAVPASAA